MIIDATLDIGTFTQVEPRIYANKPIAIGDGAWIGAAALVLPEVTIGERRSSAREASSPATCRLIRSWPEIRRGRSVRCEPFKGK